MVTTITLSLIIFEQLNTSLNVQLRDTCDVQLLHYDTNTRIQDRNGAVSSRIIITIEYLD